MTKYEILKTTSFSSIFYIQSKHIENGFYQKVLLLLMLNYKKWFFRKDNSPKKNPVWICDNLDFSKTCSVYGLIPKLTMTLIVI